MRKFLTHISSDRFSYIDIVGQSVMFANFALGRYWLAGFVFIFYIALSAFLKAVTGQSNPEKANV